MNFRALISRPDKWFLARAEKQTISADKYGHDAFRDIQVLSLKWKYYIDVFFDVGANVGQTIPKARKTWNNCRIVSFEPHPKTFARLAEKMKNVRDVDLVNCALGSEIGNKKMFTYDTDLLNSLVPNAQYAVRFRKDAEHTSIACTTLDAFCSERGIEKIDVLKIDTEGYDLEVLKGAISMLEKQAIEFIYFEFNDINTRCEATGGALAPIDEWIRPHNYRFIATYNDYIVTDGELFQVSNALYALPPR